MMEWIGDMLIAAAEYIYSLTSNFLGGEETPPRALDVKRE